jgi:elongation factor G
MTSAVQSVRNLAFVGHPSAGKTTLVDALAFALGASPRKGSVTDKTSICDTEPEEQEKGHTLQLSVVQAQTKTRTWTLMDTPGYQDFIGDCNGAMTASDVVVGVVSAAGRVSQNLRHKLEHAHKLGKGRVIVVTHLEAENHDYDALVAELDEVIGEMCVPYLVPDALGQKFSRVESIVEADRNGWKRNLMDRVMDACSDDEMMNHYLETGELSDEELHLELPLAIARGSLVPVLCCNPLSGVGVDKVLAFLEEFAPDPSFFEFKSSAGEAVALDPEANLVAQVFNVRSDPHVGKVCTARIHAGQMTSHDSLVGPHSGGKGEKLGGLFRQVGKRKRDPIETAKAGEIVAFTKVEHVSLGDSVTLAGKEPLALPPIELPEPMVALALQPKSRADEQKIGETLKKVEAEDPTVRVKHDPETHELVLYGMSDLHLQVVEARLKRRFGVEVTTHLPRIAYRETVTRPAEGHHRHKKQSGGRGQFGECYVRVRPLPKGSGVNFTDAVVGGSIPRNLIPAVEKGMREIVGKGVLTHSQVVDLDFEVYDGKYHDVDSDEASFKTAGARAFMDAFNKAQPVLLEPVMEMAISIPTECAGTIFSDLTSHRRAHVLDQWTEADGRTTVIKAHAPLSAIQTYQRELKSQTAGEGVYTLKLADYQPVPTQEQHKLLTLIGKKHDLED